MALATAAITGERIFAARVRAGLSRLELAEQIGAGLRSVQRWEAGAARPRELTLARIAEATGVTLAFLYGLEDGDGGEQAA